MPISLGFWKCGCPNRGDSHITVTAAGGWGRECLPGRAPRDIRQSFTRGGSALRSKPEPFYRPFLTDKIPLSSLVFNIWKYKMERSPLWARCRAKRAVYPTQYPARSQSLQSFWLAPKIRTMITKTLRTRLTTMRDKSVETYPQNGPFLHSGHTYPLPLSTPTPSPQNQCCILDPQVFLVLHTTWIRVVRGFTAFKRNEIINELNVW